MTVIEDFKTRFPEFDTDEVDTYLPTLIGLWEYYWGGEYEDAGVETVLNLLAHMLIQETDAGSGALKDETSKSVGNVSASYSIKTESERALWFRATKTSTPPPAPTKTARRTRRRMPNCACVWAPVPTGRRRWSPTQCPGQSPPESACR